jgi:hypothetical protein
MFNGPLVHSINNSRNSVLSNFEKVQYPSKDTLYNFVCMAKNGHILMPILVVIYGLLCTGSELKNNKRNAR